jgi:hypothetical protein
MCVFCLCAFLRGTVNTFIYILKENMFSRSSLIFIIMSSDLFIVWFHKVRMVLFFPFVCSV